MKQGHFTWTKPLGWLGLLLGLSLLAWAPVSAKASATKAKASATKAKASAAKAKANTPASKASLSKVKHLPKFLIGLYIFLLAIFVGFEVITKVPPTLHTPLMSGANAISGITIVGALYCARSSQFSFAKILGLFAVIFAMVNVVGGFLVTNRMLQMFKKK